MHTMTPTNDVTMATTNDVAVPTPDMRAQEQAIDAIAEQLHDDSAYVTLEIPTSLYTELQALTHPMQCTPLDVVVRLVAERVYHMRARKEALERLITSIQEQGGLDVPDDEDELIEHMRKIRQEIYEEEYAHLYDHLYR